MRHALKLSSLALVAALGAQTANAQQLLLDNFATSLSAVQGQSALTIDPVTGSVTVRSSIGTFNQCTSPSGGGTVSFNVPPTPTSGNINTEVTLNWTATGTSGATPCTTTLGSGTNWAGAAVAASASRSVTLPGTAGSIAFGITCNLSGGGTINAQTTITVVDPGSGGGGLDCTGTPEMTVVSQPATWTDVFGGSQPFPNPTGNFKPVNIASGASVALRFVPSNVTSLAQGRVETSEASGLPGGPLRMSISRCPGDFRPAVLNVTMAQNALNAKQCLFPGDSSAAQLLFFTGGGPNEFLCPLLPNTTYYVNITHKIPPPNAAECASSICTTLLGARTLSRSEAEELGIPYLGGDE